MAAGVLPDVEGLAARRRDSPGQVSGWRAGGGTELRALHGESWRYIVRSLLTRRRQPGDVDESQWLEPAERDLRRASAARAAALDTTCPGWFGYEAHSR